MNDELEMHESTIVKFSDRRDLKNIKRCGVYSIFYSETDISNSQKSNHLEKIIYIGQSRSRKGIDGRIYRVERCLEKEFDTTRLHSGFNKMLRHYDYDFFPYLYISINAIVNIDAKKPSLDERVLLEYTNVIEMKEVVEYKKAYNETPKFNANF